MRLRNKLSNLSGNSREILYNVIGSFGVRGLSMVFSFFTMPVYIRFFEDSNVLGVWYTLLSVMNWVLYFDLGIGNGLRNELPECIAHHDEKRAKEVVSSTYFSTILLVMLLAVIGTCLIHALNWNSVLNVSPSLVNNATLVKAIQIVYLGIMVQFVLKLITSFLYAIQRSAIVNLMTLCSTVLTLLMVHFSQSGTAEYNLTHMAVINVIAVNIPFLAATLILFCGRYRQIRPDHHYFRKDTSVSVLNIGLQLLWLQLVFMVISNTNELLISHLTGSANVVEYQAYNRIFNTISSVFTLALTPIWSAVTKAKAERKYSWIRKLNRLLLLSTLFVVGVEMLVVPVLQWVINIWLGENYILVSSTLAVIFVVFNGMNYLHNVNTSFGNGMSYFTVQKIWMTFAAIVDIPLAWLFANITGSWIGIILANILAMLPFEIIEIVKFDQYIRQLDLPQTADMGKDGQDI